jgi:DnaJ like chaperone protein
MTWQGAFFGAVLGLLLTHNLYGVLLGAIIGQMLSAGMGAARPAFAPGAVSEVFFRATFTLMGHVAKSDGRVSESEIQAARQLMQDLKLEAEQVGFAIGFFRQGKSPGFDAERMLTELREACGPRHDLMRLFMELQLRAAILGNGASGMAHTILERTAARLGLSGLEFVHMEALLRDQYQARSRGGPNAGATYSRPSNLADAYQELEVPSGATDEQVKKAYRRQMSRHHPDKLVANGLPESMAELAKEKTQRIQEAYESICAARGMK